MKIVKRLLLAFMATCLLAGALLVASATTEIGLRCLISLANSLTGTIFSVGSASGTLLGPLHLRQLRYADGVDTVLIDSLQLNWSPRQLLDGHIVLTTVTGQGIRVLLGESAGETVLPPFSLPLSLEVKHFQVSDISLSSAGEEIQRIEHASLKQLSYEGDQIRFTECTLAEGDNRIDIEGGLQTNAQYLLQATATAHLFFPDYQPITATATLSGPLNSLKIIADLQQPLVLHLDGELKEILGVPSWSAIATSQEVALTAINRAWPDQSFRQATLQGQGTLESYRLTLGAETGIPGLPTPVGLRAELQGNANGLECPHFTVIHDKALLSAQGHLQWDPIVSWQADIQGTQLDPSVFSPKWPGQFSGKVVTKGQIDQSPAASFQLSELKGTLRGYPLSGKGTINVQGETLTFPEFTLTSGNSRLEVKGSSAATLDLDLRLHSGNLAEVLPQGSGSLEAKAHLSGNSKKPALDLQLKGSEIGFERNKIGHLIATAHGLIANDGRLQATVQLHKATLSGISLDQASLDLQGSLEQHSLKLAASNNAIKAGCEFQGKLAAGQWQGALRQSQFSHSGWGSWLQQGPSDLLFSPTQVKFATTCLKGPTNSTVCADGSWNGNEQTWRLQAKAIALPLPALTQSLTVPWPIEGTVNSSLHMQGRRQQISQAHFSLETDGMQLTAPLFDGQQQKLTWQSNHLRGDYADEQLHLALDSLLAPQNSFRIEVRQKTADPVGDLLTRPLQANIQLNLQDLSLISILSSQAVIASGKLQGLWSLKGSLPSPQFSGDLTLIDGKAEVPALGITLAPLHLSMKGDAKKVDIQASARSGTGELRATSTLTILHPEQTTIRVHLVGENFHAAKLPGLDLTLSPDLILALNKEQLNLQGRITLPKAQVTSINFDQATAPSGDIVIIDDGPHAATASQPLYLDLDIVTGEEVLVDAYGLRAVIKGNLHIEGRPGRPLIGTGTLSVNNGTFSLYGKRLKIDIGRVFYSGGPLTNPGIDLRSERKTDKTTTGVTIEGFLQHPEISFYSTPAMEQSAIIKNLLEDTAIGGETREDLGVAGTAVKKIGLGGLLPFLQSLKKLSMIDEIKLESGDEDEDRSLVFGSWLTPDLYVSYGKDLVKESGTFSSRLNLGSGFSLTTETGASQSGGDIKYEFEH